MPALARASGDIDDDLAGLQRRLEAQLRRIQALERAQAASASLLRWPLATVYRSTDLVVPHNATTWVVFDAFHDDTDGMWDPDFADQLVIATPGRYVLVGHARFGANTTGLRSLAITLNSLDAGADAVASTQVPGVGNLGPGFQAVSRPVACAPGDVVRMRLYQDSGVALTCPPNRAGISLSVHRVAPLDYEATGPAEPTQ